MPQAAPPLRPRMAKTGYRALLTIVSPKNGGHALPGRHDLADALALGRSGAGRAMGPDSERRRGIVSLTLTADTGTGAPFWFWHPMAVAPFTSLTANTRLGRG